MLRSNSPVMMARPLIPTRNTSCSALYQSPRKFGANELPNAVDRKFDIAGSRMSARFEPSRSTQIPSNALQVLVVGDKENQSKGAVDPPMAGTKVLLGQKAVFCHELTQSASAGQLAVPQVRKDDIPDQKSMLLPEAMIPSLVPRLQAGAQCGMSGNLQNPIDDDPVNRYISKATMEFTQAEVVALLKTQADDLRNEFYCMSARLMSELEARLTLQIEETRSKSKEQVKALEARVTEKMQSLKTEKHEDSRSLVTSRNEDFVNDISEHVIAKVNAVLESLNSLKADSSLLVHMLGKEVPCSKGKQPEEDVSLEKEFILETPPKTSKCSTPLASDACRTCQQCNRDSSDPSAQWSEEKLALLVGECFKNSRPAKCIAGTGEAGDKQEDLDENDYLEAVIKPCNGIQISAHSL